MSDFAGQEEFPMKIRVDKASDPPKGEIRSESNEAKREENDVLSSNPNNIRKISWEGRSPQHQRTSDSGLTNDNTCQSCGNTSRQRAMYHANYSGRMSLPVNGKYGNNFHRKTNGLEANAATDHLLVKVNGSLSPRLNNEHSQRSGNVNCCGSSLKRAFRERDPEKPWKSKGDYFVAVLTYLLGVGNVIRFPQLCFKHGGGKEWSNFIQKNISRLSEKR